MKKLHFVPFLASSLASLFVLLSVSIVPLSAFAAVTGSLSVSPGSTTANANGNVKGLASGQTIHISYGLKTSTGFDFKTADLVLDSQGNFSASLPSLNPATEYSAQIFSSDSASVGGIVNFTTLAAGVGNPSKQNNADLNIQFQLDNPLTGTQDLPSFLTKILNAVILILTPVVTLMLLYAGFLFVKAQGNPSKIEEAKGALLHTVIGAAIVLGAVGWAAAIKATVSQF